MSTPETPDHSRHKQPRWYQRVAVNLGLAPEENLRDTLERAIQDQSNGTDVFSQQERTMLLNTLRFGGLRVSDVMVPRVDVVAVSQDATVAALLRLFAEAGHSRIPVYSESLDDPLGMIHIKDLMAWITQGATAAGEVRAENGGEASSNGLELQCVNVGATVASAGLVREVLFVPPSMPVVDLLLRMQATHIHLALVVDEHGGTDGLVSIEDLVEEIVGDIEDEHDIDEIPPIRRDGAGLIASARTPIEDIERGLGLKLSGDKEGEEEVDTLGGLLFAMAGRVPPRGEIIKHPSGVDFEILEASARRINKVRIIRRPDGDGTGGSGEEGEKPANSAVPASHNRGQNHAVETAPARALNDTLPEAEAA